MNPCEDCLRTFDIDDCHTCDHFMEVIVRDEKIQALRDALKVTVDEAINSIGNLIKEES